MSGHFYHILRFWDLRSILLVGKQSGGVMGPNEHREDVPASAAPLPENPQDVPEPVGLLNTGYWAQTVARWVTDTGVAVRARLPFLTKMADRAPEPSKQLLSGTTQLALLGFLAVELLLLFEMQIRP